MTTQTTETRDRLSEILERLTHEQQREVLDFAAFPEARRTGRPSAAPRDETSEPSAVEPKTEKDDWKAALRQARGMWKDREDLPEFFEELRRSWDRHL